MARGISAPEGRTIVPEGLHLHLPKWMYSSASSHALITCPALPQNLQQGAFFCLAPGSSTVTSVLTVSWPVMNICRLALRVTIVCQSASHFAATVSAGAGDRAHCACGDVSVERGDVETVRGAIGAAA